MKKWRKTYIAVAVAVVSLVTEGLTNNEDWRVIAEKLKQTAAIVAIAFLRQAVDKIEVRKAEVVEEDS